MQIPLKRVVLILGLSAVITYTYDPLARRITKSIDATVVEKYLWGDRSALLAVYDGTNNQLFRFEYADGRMPLAMLKGATHYYLIYDQMGTLRLVTEDDGTVVRQIDYDAFGNITGDSDSSFSVPLGFAGGLPDSNTGLIHFATRDYDPAIGRWTAKDSLFFEGGDTNLYSYASNDPMNFIDSSGHSKMGPGGTFSDIINKIRDGGLGFIEEILTIGESYHYKAANIMAEVTRNLRNRIDHCYEKNEREYQETLTRNKNLKEIADWGRKLLKEGVGAGKDYKKWVKNPFKQIKDRVKD